MPTPPKPQNDQTFQKNLQAHADTQISPEKQAELNTATPKSEGLTSTHQDYLTRLLSLINSGAIDLTTPSSLINQEIYNQLPPSAQSKVELNTQAMLRNLNRIKKLNDATDHATESYEMESLLSHLQLEVKRLEDELGDVLKI